MKRAVYIGIVAFYGFLFAIGCDNGSSGMTYSEHARSSSSSTEQPKLNGVQHDVGYVGHIGGAPTVPLVVNASDIDVLLAKDKDGMYKLSLQSKFMIANEGAECKLIERTMSGLVRVRFTTGKRPRTKEDLLSGNLRGVAGWMPYEFLK